VYPSQCCHYINNEFLFKEVIQFRFRHFPAVRCGIGKVPEIALMIRLHIYIGGHVQGVGYRYYASRKARGLGVTGWIRNLLDGRVEAEVQGEKQMVDQLMDRLFEGPSTCYVARIDRKEIPIRAGENDFEISL
jgi:acylphosphatase